MNFKKLFLLSAMFAVALAAYPQGLKAFKLKNGMSVYIWEDASKSDVFGSVVVRTGSVNDPEEYTGLAHYLEHVMFKGTEKIGALDWEKEKTIYEQIIAKYDEMAEEADPSKKESINLEINKLSIEQGKISLSQEFSELIEGMGGTGLNAATSFDYTFYHNSFPPYQINKWLTINSERFINPVFRTFQSELETVYEEYNRSKDNSQNLTSSYLLKQAFAGHPYSREILGLSEHLKNPRLSKLIQFYNDWYTPENMALILVGNVETSKISGRIAAAFGKLPQKPVPERRTHPDLDIKGRTQYTTKFSQYPQVILVYQGAKSGHPDEIALEICMGLLSNSSRTGLLDKKVTDGEMLSAGASTLSFREQGRIIVSGIPLYDENQRRFASNKSVEKELQKAIEKIAKGEFEPWLIESIKLNLCRDFDLSMESNEFKASAIMDAFVCEKEMNTILEYKDIVMNVSIDDVKRVAMKYLNDNYIAIFNEQGKPDKKDKIKKPDFKPIEPPVGQSSLFAQQFKNMPVNQVTEKFVDWSKVQERKLNDYSIVYYTPNSENDVFTMTIKYGVGSHVLPNLEYAASLMGNAGIMGSYEPQQLKEELSKLNATCTVNADEDYLYVTLRGYEAYLQEACQLVTRQLLMPKLDEQQLNSLKGNIASSRMTRKENVQILAIALNQYIMFGDKSDYKTELTDKEVIEMNISTLTGDINRATHYASEIHYSGVAPFETVYEILSTNLPLVAGEQQTKSPTIRETMDYSENTVFFLPYNDAQQSQIYFYIPMGDFQKEQNVKRKAYSRYMNGGFNGLILNEIREKNSMAYTAYGTPTSQELPGSKTFFTGYVGTQNDKAVNAIELYLKLLTDMPERPERIDNIKSYLRQLALTNHPGDRALSRQIAEWKREGYTDDPAKEELKEIDALNFQDIVDYYNQYVKGKPIVIGILGNPKEISIDALSRFGKVIKINEKDLFNKKDKLF